LPVQHTVPPVQSVAAAQIASVPDPHEPDWQVAVPPPPSAGAKQHALPEAQSVGAEQTCGVPEGHVVWHILAAPPEPRQHCWPIAQSAVPMHGGGTRQVP
jgi:hypothetical protein